MKLSELSKKACEGDFPIYGFYLRPNHAEKHNRNRSFQKAYFGKAFTQVFVVFLNQLFYDAIY